MITEQHLDVDGNNVTLTNTFDIGSAMDLAQEANQNGGERTKNIHCLGHIPTEMWCYDPWLIQAQKAAYAGDKGEFHKYVMKFFDVHPRFRVINPKRYYQGGLTR